MAKEHKDVTPAGKPKDHPRIFKSPSGKTHRLHVEMKGETAMNARIHVVEADASGEPVPGGKAVFRDFGFNLDSDVDVAAFVAEQQVAALDQIERHHANAAKLSGLPGVVVRPEPTH